jgi:GT2 family glycosyltransferase
MTTPFISIIIRSKDEAARLRLTLASLESRPSESEIIVVDDGSSDDTAAVISEAARRQPLEAMRHQAPLGRSAAANAGARRARGEILLFLDGDNLAGPGLVSRHGALHAAAGPSRVIGRGETYHLRCTRMFSDPEAGIPWPECAGKVGQMPAAEIDRLRVTREQILHAFDEIERRAEPGIYPGAGPRRLYELEMETLLTRPALDVLWAAASGSNLSVARDVFLAAGGFNEQIDINEHRELALRLHRNGVRMRPVAGGRSYHLTHRSGWRDPLQQTAWERVFLAAHPIPAVGLLSVFWGSLSPATAIPPLYRIDSLVELGGAARGDRRLDFDVARRALKLPLLGADFWPGALSARPPARSPRHDHSQRPIEI